MALTAFASLSFLRHRRERRRLSAFFPPAVLDKLGPRDVASLAPCRRLVTVLTADLRGLHRAGRDACRPTPWPRCCASTSPRRPQVVLGHGGTVVTAPAMPGGHLQRPLDDAAHARNAVRTALELQERTLQMSARWQGRLGTPMRSGIGIATGEAVVGTMGPEVASPTRPLGRHRRPRRAPAGADRRVRRGHPHQRRHPARRGRRRPHPPDGRGPGPGATPPVTIHGVLPADIRKQPRAVLEVAATLVLLGAGQTCLVTTRDVSEGGMALGGVPASWAPGTRVEIRCEGGLLPEALLAEGVVAWRRGNEAGISFAGLDPGTAPTVAEYVAARSRR